MGRSGRGQGHHTLSKLLWLLGDNPVACVHVDQLKKREELPHQGQDFVGDIHALGSPNEQRPLFEAHLARVLEREVAEVA